MRFGKLDLNLLIALEALMQDLSVTAAARRLNMSQSALSGSLARLREFFQDDLLVLVGRSMMPTPLGLEIAEHTQVALTLIRSTITTPPQFNPATDDRTFSIIASDYLYDVFLADAMREVVKDAPGICFDISMPSESAQNRFEKGGVDLYVTLQEFLFDEHPMRPLFEDHLSAVAWTDSNIGDSLTVDEFYKHPHVVVTFGTERHPSFSEQFFAGQHVERKIEMRVQTYSAVPAALVGTDRIGIMNRRHALHFARMYPLKILPLPFAAPPLREAMQWHATRKRDGGITWLKERLLAAVKKLPVLDNL